MRLPRQRAHPRRSARWRASPPRSSVPAEIVGLALALAIPLGLFIALFLFERSGGVSSAIRFSADVLSGVPSIIIGIFAYAVFVERFHHFSNVAAGFALAVLMLPIMVRANEEAMRTVSVDLWEAGISLGARRSRVARSVVLRGALPGVVTGNLLALARGVGETAPLLFTVASPTFAMTLLIFNDATEPFPDAQQTAWGTALGAPRPRADPERGRPDDRLDTQQEDTMKHHGEVTGPASNHTTDPRSHVEDRSGRLAGEPKVPADRPGSRSARYCRDAREREHHFRRSRSPSAMSPSQMPARQVTALVGPSGCGKTSVLRAINRLHDHTGGAVEAPSGSAASTSTDRMFSPRCCAAGSGWCSNGRIPSRR